MKFNLGLLCEDLSKKNSYLYLSVLRHLIIIQNLEMDNNNNAPHEAEKARQSENKNEYEENILNAIFHSQSLNNNSIKNKTFKKPGQKVYTPEEMFFLAGQNEFPSSKIEICGFKF